MQGGIWSTQVNLFLSLMFVGSFTLGAGLIVWHTAFNANPVADLFALQLR